MILQEIGKFFASFLSRKTIGERMMNKKKTKNCFVCRCLDVKKQTKTKILTKLNRNKMKRRQLIVIEKG